MNKIVLTIFAALVLVGCQNTTSTTADQATPAGSETSETVAIDQQGADITETADLPDASLYHLDEEWETQAEDKVTLADLRGKVQMISMIYTLCDGACPRIVADMKMLKDEFEEAGGDGSDMEFVLVTMDPDHDTPEVLREFAEEQNLDSKWTLLRGSDDQTREFAAVINSKYKKLEDSEHFTHSNLITILDRDGVVMHQQEGLGMPTDKGVEVLKELLSKS